MTKHEYAAWLNQAPAGATLVYWTGELARDRGRYGPKMEWIPNPLDGLAAAVYEDSERGLVTLTQRRMSPGMGFAYRAQRTTKEM